MLVLQKDMRFGLQILTVYTKPLRFNPFHQSAGFFRKRFAALRKLFIY